MRMISRKATISIPRQCWCFRARARWFGSKRSYCNESVRLDRHSRWSSSDPSKQWGTPGNQRQKSSFRETMVSDEPSQRSDWLMQSPCWQRNSSSSGSHGCVLFTRDDGRRSPVIWKEWISPGRNAVSTTLKPRPLTFPPSVLSNRKQSISKASKLSLSPNLKCAVTTPVEEMTLNFAASVTCPHSMEFYQRRRIHFRFDASCSSTSLSSRLTYVDR